MTIVLQPRLRGTGRVSRVPVTRIGPPIHHSLRTRPRHQDRVGSRGVNQVGAGGGHGDIALGPPGAQSALTVDAVIVPLVQGGGRAHVTKHLPAGAGGRRGRGQRRLRGQHNVHLRVRGVIVAVMTVRGHVRSVGVWRHVRHVAWRHVTRGHGPTVMRGRGLAPFPPSFLRGGS